MQQITHLSLQKGIVLTSVVEQRANHGLELRRSRLLLLFTGTRGARIKRARKSQRLREAALDLGIR